MMERGVVQARPDSAPRQRRPHLIPGRGAVTTGYPDGIELIVGIVRRPLPGQDQPLPPLQAVRIAPGDGPAAPDRLVQAVHLDQADGPHHLGHPEIEPQLGPFEFAMVAEVAEQSAFIGERLVVRDDHSPFTCSHRLGGGEREDGDPPERAGEAASPVARQVGLGGVFEHRDPMALGDLQDPVHLGAVPGVVDRHDRPRARRDPALDLVRVYAVVAHLDIRERGPGAQEQRGRGGGDERHVRTENLVVPPDSERPHGHEQRARFRIHGDRVAGSDARCEALLEGGHAGPLDEPSGAHHLLGEVGLLLPDLGLRQRHRHPDRPLHIRTA